MRKKILICNPFISLGGIATFTLTLGNGLISENNDVFYLSTHYEGDYWNKLKGIFNKVYSLEETKNPILKIIKIVRLIKEINPDVIIINNCPPINYALPFINIKIKVISVIHSDDNRYYKLDSRFSGWIDYLVCPSVKLTEKILTYIPKGDFNKVVKIPHGVKIYKNIHNQNKIKDSLIFVGNIDKHKGVDLLIPILKNVVTEFESAVLYIIGKGPLKNELLRNVEENNLTNNVIFIEELDGESLRKLFLKMEVFLFPTKLESFGLVIPEAMSSGVIPVISNLKGITDQFIINNKSGFLCTKDNPDEFSQNIINIFDDIELKTTLSQKAKLFVNLEYSEAEMVKRYISIINKNNLQDSKVKRYSFKWIKLYVNNVRKIIDNG
nr:glycosyltransferase family 4 protein [uncultured Flavobacterium sp.]